MQSAKLLKYSVAIVLLVALAIPAAKKLAKVIGNKNPTTQSKAPYICEDFALMACPIPGNESNASNHRCADPPELCK